MTTDKNKSKKEKPSFSVRFSKWAYRSTAIVGVFTAAGIESAYSPLQTKIFQSAADGTAFAQLRKTGPDTAPPAVGPFDERLGYTSTLKFRKNLSGEYDIVGESTWLDRKIIGVQLNPIYDEKMQAGLRLYDDIDKPLFSFMMPRDSYATFESIPPLLVNSLLYVENRKLLNQQSSTQNPAIEWERFINATLGYGFRKAYIPYPYKSGGGSTLATQLEKFKHYPDGRTSSPLEKFSQMGTASVRSYMKGTDTVQHRRQIALEYINAMPLASYPGFGEINGYADGLLWFGSDFKDVNRILSKPEKDLSDDEFKLAAKYYRQSLALVMAVKKPTAYLMREREQLEARIDSYLPLLAEAGIISPRLRDAVAAEKLEFSDPKKFVRIKATADQKSVQSLQVGLMDLLGVKDLYELNRLDLSAKATIDGEADRAVAKILRDLKDPEKAKAAGIVGYQLLPADGTQDVTYSFTFYERALDGKNLLRVQTDNFDGPLNLNEGVKLELGSTAKLRTLVSYLEAFADLHARYAGKTPEELSAVKVQANDNLSRWALTYLSTESTDKSLNAMLEASLERTYSGNPGETFFTGGGAHTFNNFKREDNGGMFTVKKALYSSINLPFIRIMRDVVHYTQSQKMNIDHDIYDNPDSPQRLEYLKKFADAEGRTFMWKFWNEQKGKAPEEVAELLAAKTRGNPSQVAVVYRAVFPDAPLDKFTEFLKVNCDNCTPNTDYARYYNDYAPGKFNLNDQGYIAKLHPLELWLATDKTKHPDAKWDETAAASAEVRVMTYKWLIESENMRAQNSRISTVLEKEAFVHIHKTWKEKGFPFAAMVPSYASALGASGDSPYALAQLASIIQNDGVLIEPIKYSEIKFADGTPYALDAKIKKGAETRVLPTEIAKIVRREMQGVVEQGTARRAFQSVKLSDGRVLSVGAKTGTGDNRKETYASGGGVTSSVAVSRTATFVFVIDDRFYGCVTAYVEGEKADKYQFTSGLTAQIFKNVIPALRPVLDRAYGVTTPAPVIAPAVPIDEKAGVPKKPVPVKPPQLG